MARGVRPPETVVCPLCGRRGADLNLILLKAESLEDAEKPLAKWIEEQLRRR